MIGKVLVERLIVWLMATVLSVRGLHAVVTRHYESTGKIGGLTVYDGAPAVVTGIAWLAMGIAFLAFEIKRKWPQNKSLSWFWGVGWALISVCCWILPFIM